MMIPWNVVTVSTRLIQIEEILDTQNTKRHNTTEDDYDLVYGK